MRCFVAIDLPLELKQKLIPIQRGLERFGDFRFVRPENLHITLKFLGEVNESLLERVKARLGEVVLSFKSFEVELRGLGAFPSASRARVVWVGVASKDLLRLQQGIDLSLMELGFPSEREYVPHLTLARLRGPSDRRGLVEYLNSEVVCGSFVAKEVGLFKSTLTASGPIYEKLGAYRLEAEILKRDPIS